jgi:hypothetical protein
VRVARHLDQIWRKEIQALRARTELWDLDSIADQELATGRERLGRKISDHLARVSFLSQGIASGIGACGDDSITNSLGPRNFTFSPGLGVGCTLSSTNVNFRVNA